MSFRNVCNILIVTTVYYTDSRYINSLRDLRAYVDVMLIFGGLYCGGLSGCVAL
ncbi:hypothetical protein Barb4_01586 [Bacteroidales bacterium Barb4]|nr:hypothetical protein Barb4_01586 [Bacteroidales bacterium Barb4]